MFQNDFWEDRKRLLESTLSQRESELAAEVSAKNDSDVKLQESEAESRGLKTKVDELRKRIQSCEDEEGLFQKKCDKFDKKIKESDNALKILRAEKKLLSKDLDGKKKDLKKKIELASKRGERIVSSRTAEEIKSDYEGRKSFYEQNLHKIKAMDDVRRSMEKWRKEADATKEQIQSVRGILAVRPY